jgi:hypothetical protein
MKFSHLFSIIQKRVILIVLSPIILIFSIVFIEFGLKAYYAAKPERYNKSPWRLDSPDKVYNSPFIFNYTEPPFYTKNNFYMRRDSDVTEDPPINTTRILSYGDSIGEGYLVKVNETYSALLEQMLNAEGIDRYEVDNMSRGGSPSIYAMFIKHEITQFKPKKVIMEIELLNDTPDEALVEYSGLDIYNMPSGITASRYYPGFINMPPTTYHPTYWEISYIRKFLFGIKRKYDVLMEKIFPNPIFSKDSNEYYYNLGYDKRFLTKDRLNYATNRMFTTIQGIQRYLNDNGVDFLLVILPSAYSLNVNNYPTYSGDYSRYQSSSLQAYTNAAKMADALEINHIGLYEIFKDKMQKEMYFFDFCHPTPIGHQLIAQSIFDYFKTK